MSEEESDYTSQLVISHREVRQEECLEEDENRQKSYQVVPSIHMVSHCCVDHIQEVVDKE